MAFRKLAALLGPLLLALGCVACSPPKAASAGQGACGSAGSTVERELTSGGLVRQYRVHLPEGYRPERGLPTILAFHGRGQGAKRLEEYAGLDSLEAVVVYPQGTTGGGGKASWQGAPYASGADDVRFVGDLLDELGRSYCLDPSRVYATGLSNGGGFTGVLACRLADRIAAIAPVSAAFYQTGQGCEPSRAVPVLNFHGTSDPVVPFGGAASRNLPSMADWAEGWARRDGCATGPEVLFHEADVTAQRWSGCSDGAEVENYAIDGAGHTWPGAAADRASPLGSTTRTISATALIGAFFAAHRL